MMIYGVIIVMALVIAFIFALMAVKGEKKWFAGTISSLLAGGFVCWEVAMADRGTTKMQMMIAAIVGIVVVFVAFFCFFSFFTIDERENRYDKPARLDKKERMQKVNSPARKMDVAAERATENIAEKAVEVDTTVKETRAALDETDEIATEAAYETAESATEAAYETAESATETAVETDEIATEAAEAATENVTFEEPEETVGAVTKKVAEEIETTAEEAADVAMSWTDRYADKGIDKQTLTVLDQAKQYEEKGQINTAVRLYKHCKTGITNGELKEEIDDLLRKYRL